MELSKEENWKIKEGKKNHRKKRNKTLWNE